MDKIKNTPLHRMLYDTWIKKKEPYFSYVSIMMIVNELRSLKE